MAAEKAAVSGIGCSPCLGKHCTLFAYAVNSNRRKKRTSLV
jgi:hypothetical protein